MKEYPVNSISKINIVLIVARYNSKWVLCHDDINMYKCIEGYVSSGEEATDTAFKVLNSFDISKFNLFPLWDYVNEKGSCRVFFADVIDCIISSKLVYLDNILNINIELKELILKAEVIETSNRLLSFVDTLSDVKSCIVHSRKLAGSVNEISSFELILDVNNPRNFAFRLPDLLSNIFFAELQAYRVFPDKFVLNMNFSKSNPLFVVRFSIKK